MKILVVEDDELVAHALTTVLTNHNYAVEVAVDGLAAWDLVQAFDYDLIVLDVVIPKLDGISLCRQIRSKGLSTPILLLTGRDSSHEKAIGLDAGADDYIVKPFELRELLARVRALLRRGAVDLNLAATQRLQVADLELDVENRLAYRQGRTIELSEKETKLLEYFMRHVGQVLTHDQIHQYLWTEEEQPSSNVLAALVRLLRRKIEAKGEIVLVHTVYGKGYRFGDGNG